MKLKHLFVSSVFLLSGCGDNAIETVKDSHLDIDPSLSISQALDHRKICETTSWESFKDQKERNIVQYKCEIKNTTSFFDSLIPDLTSALRKKMERVQTPEYAEYSRLRNEVWRPVYSEIFPYQQQIDSDARNIEDLEYSIEHGVDESDIAAAKSELQKLKMRVDENQKKLDEIEIKVKDIEDKQLAPQEKLVKDAAIAKEQLIEQKAKELAESFKGIKVFEIYQWSVNDNGIFLVYGGTETNKKDSKKPQVYSYSDLPSSLRISYSDSSDNYQMYRRSRRDMTLIDDL